MFNGPNRSASRTIGHKAKLLESIISKSTTLAATSKKSKALSKVSRVDLKLIANGDKPLKGTILFILYTILYSCNFLCAKYLYERNSKLTPF